MENGIRILTEDEFKKMSVSIERRAQMSDVAYYFSNKNMRMCYEPYLLETGSVPKIVKNDGLIHEFKAIKIGRKFDVNLQGRVVAVTNYNLNLLKQMGIRPVIPLSMIPESIANNTINNFAYGYYPVNIPKHADQDLITVMFLSSSCNSLYSIKLDGKSYHAIEIHTPEHGIQKFINLKEHTHKFTEDNLVHSEYMWAELKRIEWAIDRNLGLAIANFIPMTNIDFNDTFYYKSFKDTNLYKWLNGEFLNTIMVNEDEKLIIPKKNNKKKEEVANENNSDIFDIDLSNFSFTDMSAQKNNRKKELGIDSESIEEFKKEIKIVTEEEAENLGKELFEKVFMGGTENYDKIPDLLEVLRLIKAGANVNVRSNNDEGNFPLIMCARGNYSNTLMALFLIKAGADINMPNNYGITPLMAAARYGNKEILEILILMGADINAKCADGNTALSSAILHNQKECFDMLVDAGANLNSANLKGQTIFDYESGIDVASSLNFDNASVSKQEISFDDLLSEAASMLQELNDDSNKKLVKGFGKN